MYVVVSVGGSEPKVRLEYTNVYEICRVWQFYIPYYNPTCSQTYVDCENRINVTKNDVIAMTLASIASIHKFPVILFL